MMASAAKINARTALLCKALPFYSPIKCKFNRASPCRIRASSTIICDLGHCRYLGMSRSRRFSCHYVGERPASSFEHVNNGWNEPFKNRYSTRKNLNSSPFAIELHSVFSGSLFMFTRQSFCKSFSTHSSLSSSLSKEERETVDNLVNDFRLANSTLNVSINGDSNNIGKDSDSGNEDDPTSQRIRQRIALAKAITLVESKSPTRRFMADVLLDRLRRDPASTTGATAFPEKFPLNESLAPFRVGIAGPPGVGKVRILHRDCNVLF